MRSKPVPTVSPRWTQKPLKKAVFPVAGFGTRFLPATKSSPKEMLPIVDTPLIQYAVEEAIRAGVEELIFVTNINKRAIEDYFDRHFELETRLKQRGAFHLASMIHDIIPASVKCTYVRQKEPLGLGDAILCAEPLIHEEPFAVILADDLIDSTMSSAQVSPPSPTHGNALQQLLCAFELQKSSIIAVETVQDASIPQYGIVDLDEAGHVRRIVEKPRLEEAPSNLGVIGRYILSPHLFSILRQLKNDRNACSAVQHGELQLTDALQILLESEPILGLILKGQRFDCGDKLGYLKAIVHYGIKHPELGTDFSAFIRQLL